MPRTAELTQPTSAPTVDPVDVSVIVATRNRQELLRTTLESVLRQRPPAIGVEVIVADNGSTDGTRAMVEDMMSGDPRLRYVWAPQSGVSFARNAGVRAARAPVVAFMDDDQQAPSNWIETVHRAFAHEPSVAFIGGRVWPLWTGEPPPDVPHEARGPASIIDRGDAPLPIDRHHWMCLPGGNMAVRRDVLDAVGGWAHHMRSQDRELTVRLLLAGHRGRYLPDLVMYHRIDASRVNRSRIRRWYAVEGWERAAYQFVELFDVQGGIRTPPPAGRRLGGVSLFVYRSLLVHAARWVFAVSRRRESQAFAHELQVRYLASYVARRLWRPRRETAGAASYSPAAVPVPGRRGAGS